MGGSFCLFCFCFSCLDIETLRAPLLACFCAHVLVVLAYKRAYVLGVLAFFCAHAPTCLHLCVLACSLAYMFVCLVCLRAWHAPVLTC